MKIKLTDEQIDQLVQNEEQKLQSTFENQVEKMKQQLDKDVLALRKKYEHFEINVQDAEPAKKRGKLDLEAFKKLLDSGKSTQEIAELMGISKDYVAITKSKLNKVKTKK